MNKKTNEEIQILIDQATAGNKKAQCIGVNRQSTVRIIKEAYGEDFPVSEFMDTCSKLAKE